LKDVPGGASAYILQQIIEQQDAYNYLDSKPQTLTAKAHRPLMEQTEIISLNLHPKIFEKFMK
jgi:hypothetical protein